MAQQIISPGARDREEDAQDGEQAAAAELAPVLPDRQREQSKWAAENLGPDRKVFVDLAGKTEVDWRKVSGSCGAAGQQPTAHSRGFECRPPAVTPAAHRC